MKRLTRPSLDDNLDALKNEILSDFNAVQIGKISSFDSSTQSAEIEIQVKRRIPNDKICSYPLLVDCPVWVLQGGGSYIDMPIEKGDYCIVLFNDRNIDEWWIYENVKAPKTKRKHSLSDGIALVGLNPKGSALPHSGSAIGLRGASKKVLIDNTYESFKSLMDDLIDAIVGIITVGSATTQTLDPESQTALNAIKIRFASLLEE